MRFKDIKPRVKLVESLSEFAPPGSSDGGDDGFSEDTLKRLAAQWWNGDEDPRVEQTLMSAGWEIGQDEGYDNGGVFVVQAGDINGNSYISWPAEELESDSLNEFAPGGAEGAGPYAYGIALKEMAELYAKGEFDLVDVSGMDTASQNQSDAEEINSVADAFMNRGMEAGREAYSMVDTMVQEDMDEYLHGQGFNVDADIHAEYQNDVDSYNNSPAGQADKDQQAQQDAEWEEDLPTWRAAQVEIAAVNPKNQSSVLHSVQFDARKYNSSVGQLKSTLEQQLNRIKQSTPGSVIRITLGGKPTDIQGILAQFKQLRKKPGRNSDVAEGGAKDRQWSNKDMEKLRVATRDFDDILSADGPDQTKHDLIKTRIKTKPMTGPKGQLPEQGMAEAADPESQKFGKYIKKYFGQIYDYGDDGLEYLDNNAPFWAMLFDKHDGDIDYIIAMEPADVLKKAALELKAVAGDLKYELDEQGVAEDYNAEYDDEAGMANNNLETLARAVEGIDDLINTGDNLPEWCQEKIAVAKSMLVAVWDYMESEQESEDPEIAEMYEAMQDLAEEIAAKDRVNVDLVWESFESLPDNMLYETAAWRRKEGKSKSGGLNAKGVASYRRENPGSKLQTAVTTKPSKLKPGSKAAKRRKSFCARMSGVKGPMKKPSGKPTRKALALRKWNC